MRSGTGMVLAAALAGGMVVASAVPAWASSPGVITTVAGGPGRGAARNVSQVPAAVAATSDGTLYVGDLHGVVRVVAASAGTFYGRAMTTGDIYTVAGNGTGGFSGDGGPATAAELFTPVAVAADAAGNL